MASWQPWNDWLDGWILTSGTRSVIITKGDGLRPTENDSCDVGLYDEKDGRLDCLDFVKIEGLANAKLWGELKLEITP